MLPSSDAGRGLRAAGLAVLLLGAASAWAHGERVSGSPFVEGCKAVIAEPACLMVLLASAGLLAQPGQARTKTALQGALSGLCAGTLLAATGLENDLTLVLLGLAFALGALVAWARPLPVATRAALAGVAAIGVMLMSAPAVGPLSALSSASVIGFRLVWLGGAAVTVALLFGNAYALIRALLGSRPGHVKRMLLRVAGSWSAAAALLVAVLEIGRRSG